MFPVIAIIVGLMLLLLPIWFVLSLVSFIKNRKKNGGKCSSTGLEVNFILSCVGLGVWIILVLLIIAFLALSIAIVQTM